MPRCLMRQFGSVNHRQHAYKDMMQQNYDRYELVQLCASTYKIEMVARVTGPELCSSTTVGEAKAGQSRTPQARSTLRGRPTQPGEAGGCSGTSRAAPSRCVPNARHRSASPWEVEEAEAGQSRSRSVGAAWESAAPADAGRRLRASHCGSTRREAPALAGPAEEAGCSSASAGGTRDGPGGTVRGQAGRRGGGAPEAALEEGGGRERHAGREDHEDRAGHEGRGAAEDRRGGAEAAHRCATADDQTRPSDGREAEEVRSG
jgi:hypothetical protein